MRAAARLSRAMVRAGVYRLNPAEETAGLVSGMNQRGLSQFGRTAKRAIREKPASLRVWLVMLRQLTPTNAAADLMGGSWWGCSANATTALGPVAAASVVSGSRSHGGPERHSKEESAGSRCSHVSCRAKVICWP